MVKKTTSGKRESIGDRADRILHLANELKNQGRTWVAANNALFSPQGLATILFSSPKERKAFSESSAGKKVTKILESLSRAEEDEPTASGKFMVRVPKSLHLALQQEAEREGISLNQLVLTKIAVGLQMKLAS